MSHDHTVEHSPVKEVKYALVFVLLFAGLVALIYIPGFLRPAAPKTMAETIAIIAEPKSEQATAPVGEVVVEAKTQAEVVDTTVATVVEAPKVDDVTVETKVIEAVVVEDAVETPAK